MDKENTDNIPNDIIINKKDKYQKGNNILKFSNVDEKEIQIFLKLLKSWLVKYSNLDTNFQNVVEEDLIINKKTNFARVKLFIDYFEMLMRCEQLTQSMEKNFIKFSKFSQNLTHKVLLASNKINKETTIFTDIILVNYPNIIEKLNSLNFNKIINTSLKSGQIYAFKKAFVMKLKQPSFLLWSKKIFYTCDCKGEKGEYFQKFYNIYKNQTERNFNSGSGANFNVYDSICEICKKPYIQDKNSDIFIECQEITFAIDSESECLVNNVITVWTYGDLINSVKEGDCVSLITFYLPNSGKTTYEKDFEYGSFIALNFNIFFTPTFILKEKNFSILHSKNLIEGVLIGNNKNNPFNNNMNVNFSTKFNENTEIDILRSVNFQRQVNSDMVKLILRNFTFNKTRNLIRNTLYEQNSHKEKNFHYNFFLHFALDLSITQRDYLNKTKKSAFMNENRIEGKQFGGTGNPIDGEKNKSQFMNTICQSRNLSLKTKIFENTKKEKIEKIKNQRSQEEDFKKHFRLSRQIDYQKYFECINTSSNHSLMTKPLNIFIIFDEVNKENFEIFTNYANVYKSLISIYPFFNSHKFNKEFLIRYLITCNNGIVLVPSVELLSKNEIDVIQSVISENSQTGNLNVAFWFCSSFNKSSNKGKKNTVSWEMKNKSYDGIVEKCEIVLNLSNKFNKLRGVGIGNNKGPISDNDEINYNMKKSENEIIIANFSIDFSNQSLEKEFMKISANSSHYSNVFDLHIFEEFKLMKMMNDKEILKNIKSNLCKTNHFFQKSNTEAKDLNNTCNQQNLNFDDSFSSAKLMEDYFIIKRKVSNVEFDDLVIKLF